MNKIVFNISGSMSEIYKKLDEEETPYEAIISTVNRGVRQLIIITDPIHFEHFKKLISND